MGRSQRQKGKRGERETATEIREALPEIAASVRRGWQAREAADSPDVCGLPGWWVESKCGKKPNPRAALDQAIEESATAAARPGGVFSIPVAVIRDDRKGPFAVLRWADLLELIARDYRRETADREREKTFQNELHIAFPQPKV